jgi:hypothetical protein
VNQFGNETIKGSLKTNFTNRQSLTSKKASIKAQISTEDFVAKRNHEEDLKNEN